MTDDTELLVRYTRDRSESAFVEIVHRHLDGIYSAVLRRVGGDAHLAEDVTQKVFAALARKAPALATHPFLIGWLYTAAKAEAANTVRAEQRRKHREQEAQAMADPHSPSASADWSRLAPALDEAIDELPEADRQVVLLRFVNRRRYAEIGAALHLSEDAARMRTNRALDQLRGILRRRGVVSTAAALEFVLAENAVGAAPAGIVTSVTKAALAGGASSAGTAVVGTSLLGLLVSPTALTLAVMIAALGAAVHENLQFQRQDALLAQARADLAAASARAQAHEQKFAADLAQRRAPAAAAPLGAAPGDARARGDALMARHPDVRAALQAFADAGTRATYAELFRELNLTADQIQQFESYKRAGFNMGRMAPGGEIQLRLDNGRPPEQAMTGIHQLLGDAGFARYLDYTRTSRARNTSADLATELAQTDAPLTPAQTEQMAALFEQHDQRGQVDWAPLQADAQGVLNSAQLVGLQDLRTLDEADRSLQ